MMVKTGVGMVGTVEGTGMRELRALAILVLISACLLMGVPLLTSPPQPPPPAIPRQRPARAPRQLTTFGTLGVASAGLHAY